MPRNEMFAPLKDERLPKFSARRVFHSTTNFVKSMDPVLGFSNAKGAAQAAGAAHPHMQGLKGAVQQMPGQITTAGSSAVQTGELVLGTGGMVVGAMAIAGYAGAATAAAAAFSGPQAAVSAGVIALVFLAKSAYSNREAAHAELTKYGWSLIDDDPPAKSLSGADLHNAADAALTLIQDGQNQIVLMHNKLLAAKNDLDSFNNRLLSTLSGIDSINPQDPNGPQRRTTMLADCAKMVEGGMEQGGAINEYVRRIVHTGNYVQAPHIYSLALREKLMPGTLAAQPFTDYFAGTDLGMNARSFFSKLESFYSYIGQVTNAQERAAGAVPFPGSAPAVPRR